MNTLIYVLNTFVQQLAISFYYHKIGRPKYKYPITLLCLFTTIIAEYAVSYFFIPNAPMFPQYIVKIVINFIVFYMIFEGRLIHKLIQYTSFYVIALIVEVIMLGTLKLLFSELSYTDYNVVNDSYIIAAGRIMAADLLLAVLLAVSEIVILRLNKDKADRNDLKDIFFIIVLVLGHFVYLMIYYKLNNDDRTDTNNLIQLAYQVLFLVLVFIQYYTMKHSRELMKAEQEYLSVKSEMDNNYRYYQLAESKFDEISRLRHDLNNQLSTVRQLLADGNDIERAQNIMERINESLSAVKPAVYCEDKALNAVLSVKSDELRARDIELRLSFEGSLAPNNPTNDLCTLFSDIIDICADHCPMSDQTQYIDLSCTCTEDTLTLSAVLPCAAEENRQNGKAQSSAEMICKKYGGTFTQKTEGGKFTSTASIRQVY